MNRFNLACRLVDQGFSVLPLSNSSKRPVRKWKEFQTRLPQIDELSDWFLDHNFALGIITGALSDITIIDCDNAEAIEAAHRLGLTSPLSQQTSRGVHYVFRHNHELNTVNIDAIKGLDRRGQGGMVKAYPDCIHWTRAAVEALPMLERRN